MNFSWKIKGKRNSRSKWHSRKKLDFLVFNKMGLQKYNSLCNSYYTFQYVFLIANVQNICNPIGWKEHNIGLIVLSVLTIQAAIPQSVLPFCGVDAKSLNSVLE